MIVIIYKYREFITGVIIASIIWGSFLYQMNKTAQQSLSKIEVEAFKYELKADESFELYKQKNKLANSLFTELEALKAELRVSFVKDTKKIDNDEKARNKHIESIDTNNLRDSAYAVLQRFIFANNIDASESGVDDGQQDSNSI